MKSLDLYDLNAVSFDEGIEELTPLFHLERTINRLYKNGIEVRHHQLLADPMAFMQEPKVNSVMQEKGDSAFPLLIGDGEILKSGDYPTNEEWSTFTGIPAASLPEVPLPQSVALWAEMMKDVAGSGCGGSCSSCSGCSSCDEEDL